MRLLVWNLIAMAALATGALTLEIPAANSSRSDSLASARTCVTNPAGRELGCVLRMSATRWDANFDLCNLAIYGNRAGSWIFAHEGFIGAPDVLARRVRRGSWRIQGWNAETTYYRGLYGWAIATNLQQTEWKIVDQRGPSAARKTGKVIARASGRDGEIAALVLLPWGASCLIQH